MKVGDKVKVIARKCGHAFRIGEVVTLCTLETESGHRFKGDTGMRFWMTGDEYDVIQPTGTLAEIGAKVGDVVEWEGEGIKYEVTGVRGDDYRLKWRPEYCGTEYEKWYRSGKSGLYLIVSRASDLSELDYTSINVEKPIYAAEPDKRPLEHFQSGPVITETVKRIVPGVYGRISIHKNTDNDGKVLIRLADGAGEVNLNNCGHFMSRAELIAARDILTQLIDAMPSE